MSFELHLGNCLDILASMPDNSIDAIVTDPPYGLAFMGKKWDYDVPSEDIWKECLRVLKPGGHLLAFAGTRTQHRMAVRIEDAGFEIRDMIAWVYGSGFPKSHDISKAIDKMDAAEEQQARRYRFTEWVRSQGVTSKQIDEATYTNMGGHYTTQASQPAIMTREHLEQCRHLFTSIPEWVEREADIRSVESKNFAKREVVGSKIVNGEEGTAAGYKNGIASIAGADVTVQRAVPITAPATPAAKQWQGWGTALKPALEPITVARKPFTGTVAANVLEWGTGAINVDGCRVGDAHAARWPANLIHDDGDEVQQVLGDASRFFYCAKASKADRGENHHPTVKPTDLMRYLCRLVTPPNGTVLDPFMGSGSTGKAAILEGFQFIGIDMTPEYVDIARARIEHAVKLKPNKLDLE
jgi:DNA modification methylase